MGDTGLMERMLGFSAFENDYESHSSRSYHQGRNDILIVSMHRPESSVVGFLFGAV